MNHYRLDPFHIHASGEHTILITGNAVVKVVNEAFCRLLRRMLQDGCPVWAEDKLAQHIAREELPHEPTRDFLLAQGVLRHVANPDERVSAVRVASTAQHWRDMVCSNIEGIPVHATTSFDAAAREAGRNELWVLLIERYSEKRVADFYARLRCAPTASGLIAYWRFRTLCLSSVYSPSYGTPCHFCHAGWESHAKAKSGVGAATISSLMRIFEASGDSELPLPTMRDLDWPAASAFLVNQIQQLAGVASPKLLQEEITTRHEFDLQTFTRSRHVAVHWPGCDCQYQQRSAG